MNDLFEKDELTVDPSLICGESTENTQTEVDRDEEYKEFKQTLEDVNAELLSEAENEPKTEEEGSDCEEKAPIVCPPEEGSIEPEKCVEEGDKKEESKVESEGFASGEEYKEYKLNKIYSKINYDLTSPLLTVSELKKRIQDAQKYNFNCFELLTSKIKDVKKGVKFNAPLCAVIGLGESTTLAKKWEIRQAKWQKVKEIEVQISLSSIKEGKKRALVKELSSLKKTAGKKISFKFSIDSTNLSNEEFNLALDSALGAKAQRIVLKNYTKINSAYILTAIKKCSGKCLLELHGEILSSKPITHYSEVGFDYFATSTAVALAESIKLEF